MIISATSYASSSYSPPTAPRSSEGRAVAADGQGKTAQKGSLTPEEQDQVRKLKARDQEVRQHEQAHLGAAGGMATSGASFTYQRGPDGINYAIGGEVSISTSAGNSPEETVRRARTIRAAALAPAEPSGQDQAVAAQASQMEAQANAELAQQRASEATASAKGDSGSGKDSRIAGYYAGSTPSSGGSLNVYA